MLYILQSTLKILLASVILVFLIYNLPFVLTGFAILAVILFAALLFFGIRYSKQLKLLKQFWDLQRQAPQSSDSEAPLHRVKMDSQGPVVYVDAQEVNDEKD